MEEGWPDWAMQPVELAEPAPAWAEMAAGLVHDLQARLPTVLAGPVEHVGSTSIPLPAKPVVDLMGPATSLAACQTADAPLAEAGWALVPPELDQRPWRRFYVLPDEPTRMAHLQLVERSHRRWRDTIAFRDALRAEPALGEAYVAVKRAAADAHRDDREAYSAAKETFIRDVLDRR